MTAGRPIKDLTGLKFGCLTCEFLIRRENNSTLWQVKCDCGSTLERSLDYLRWAKGKDIDCKCDKDWQSNAPNISNPYCCGKPTKKIGAHTNKKQRYFCKICKLSICRDK